MRLSKLATQFVFVVCAGIVFPAFGQNAVRPSVECTVGTAVNKNLFWNQRPVVRIRVENRGTEPIDSLRYELHAQEWYYDREAWSVQDSLREIPSGGNVERSETIEVPYGVYRVSWQVADRAGALKSGAIPVAHMMVPCYHDAPEAVRAYDRHWSMFGGVFGSEAVELASDMGARWNRYGDRIWQDCEKEPGRFDMRPLVDGLKKYAQCGVECVLFQSLNHWPPFYNPNQPAFAPAYGAAIQRMAEAGAGLVAGFELDDVPARLPHTELERHGAAAFRSRQPNAPIVGGSLASADLGWLEIHAARNFTDVLDVVCTHPYTANDSPETEKVCERLGQVNALIDRLGGMKVQWTIEYAYRRDLSAQRLSEWIPHHYLIGAAAGVERHDLYTWENDYGVFQGTAQPAAASVHTLARLLEGHRFAGLLSHAASLWACVFERAGRPLAVAWSPEDRAQWTVAVNDGFQALDLFGNPLPFQAQAGNVTVHVTGAPIYVLGVADAVPEEAARNQARREYERFVQCVKAAQADQAPVSTRLTMLADKPDASTADIQQALSEWTPAAPVSNPEQAVVAQALRWYWIVGRLAGATEQAGPVQASRGAFRKHLAESVENDVDVPSLRYLLTRWDRLADEENVALEFKAPELAARLRAMQTTLAGLCERFAQSGQRVLYSMWPYLYTVAEDGTIQERLRFVPGEVATVNIRVSSYSKTDHAAVVTFELPEGWKAEPESLRLQVTHASHTEAQVRVLCPANPTTDKPVFKARLRIDGLPDRVVMFDNFEIDRPS